MASSKWDYIPNEILEKIVNKISLDGKASICPLVSVNKQWLTVSQPIIYKKISIDCLDFSKSKILHTIVHYKCQPGIWIKNLEIRNWKTPLDSDKFNTDADPLYILMTHCPNVIDLKSDAYCIDWAHFLAAHQNCGLWKLQYLPAYGGFIEDSDCALGGVSIIFEMLFATFTARQFILTQNAS